MVFVVVILSCNSKNQNIPSVDDSKNIFQSYQSISGSVNGRWKKVNNPYRIINDIVIESGDTLIIDTGVQISNCGTIYIDHNAALIINGSPADPAIISWDKDMDNYVDQYLCNGSLYSRGGSIIASNAILSGFLDVIPVDNSMVVDLNHVTWINSIIHYYLSGFWKIEMPTYANSNGYNDVVYSPRVKISNSIVTTYQNMSGKDYWFGVHDGYISIDEMNINSNCIWDYTKTKSTEMYKYETIYGSVTSNKWNNGINNDGHPEFNGYPDNDGLDSESNSLQYIYDVNANPEKYDFHIKAETICSEFGAYK